MPTLIPIIHIAIHLSLNVQTLSYNRDGAVIQSVQMSRYDKRYSLQQLYLLSYLFYLVSPKHSRRPFSSWFKILKAFGMESYSHPTCRELTKNDTSALCYWDINTILIHKQQNIFISAEITRYFRRQCEWSLIIFVMRDERD